MCLKGFGNTGKEVRPTGELSPPVTDTSGNEQVEDVSGADRARADAVWGETPAALGNSGAPWHDRVGVQ